ncbi:MAG: hypothetical protein IJQ89_00935 [Bacteroidales bacterium]|nr:hypothetical protein [Bacteroidales bacterium]
MERNIRIVARCIYYKAVRPSCDIVEMDWDTWREFLYAKADRRIDIVINLTGKESIRGCVRELTWIRLDECIEVTIKKTVSRETPKQKHTKEEIEQCRKEVIEEITKVNYKEISTKEKQDEIDRIKKSPDFVLNQILDYSSPEIYVYYLFL